MCRSKCQMRYILIKSGAINLAPFKIELKIEFKFLLRLLAGISARSVFLGFLSAMRFCRDFNDFSKHKSCFLSSVSRVLSSHHIKMISTIFNLWLQNSNIFTWNSPTDLSIRHCCDTSYDYDYMTMTGIPSENQNRKQDGNNKSNIISICGQIVGELVIISLIIWQKKSW